MNSSYIYALWISFIVVTPCIAAGFTVAYSSIALPEMQLGVEAASWFSCLFSIAAPFGCLITGFVIDKYGRKTTIVLCNIPAIIGWLLISLGDNLWFLFIGRILTGLSTGAAYFPTQVYLAEYAELDPKLIHLRTGFTNWAASASTFGILVVLLLGALFSHAKVAFISFILTLCSFCCIYIFIPESPMWLYQNGRYGDAEWAQKRLNLSVSFENYPLAAPKKANKSILLRKLSRKDVYIPLFITTGSMILLMLSGCPIYSAYLVDMISVGSSSLQDAYTLSVISGTVLFVSSIAQINFVVIAGVRKLAIGSSLGLAASTLINGIGRCLIDTIYGDIAQKICVVALWAGTFCIGFGYLSIPRAILGELFPTDAKGLAMIPTIVMYATQSLAIKFHPTLEANFGVFLFIGYAGVSCLQALFMYCFLPETVGKSIKEINDEFRS